MNKITRATTTTPTILGEQRPEAGVALRPAPTAAQLKAALAAANLSIPKKPEKPAKVAAGGRRGRARIDLKGPLSEAFQAMGWEAPTRPTLLVVPPAAQVHPDALSQPVPAEPASWSVGAASLLLLAHGARGLLPCLSEGQTVTFSSFLVVAHDLKARGGFPAYKGGRTGDLGYVGSCDSFVRALALASRRMVSLDFIADTICLLSARN